LGGIRNATPTKEDSSPTLKRGCVFLGGAVKLKSPFNQKGKKKERTDGGANAIVFRPTGTKSKPIQCQRAGNTTLGGGYQYWNSERNGGLGESEQFSKGGAPPPTKRAKRKIKHLTAATKGGNKNDRENRTRGRARLKKHFWGRPRSGEKKTPVHRGGQLLRS